MNEEVQQSAESGAGSAEATGSADAAAGGLQLDQIMGQLQTFAVEYGMKVVGAILILIVGWIIAGLVARGIRNGLGKSGKVDGVIVKFAATTARTLVLIFTVIAVLSKFGVETASIVGVFAAASLAIGLALQGTLSNFAAGIMILLFRPFGDGENVELNGVFGSVQNVGIFATELKPPSGEFILIPNAQIWGSTIKNFTRNGTRRIAWEIGIGYGDDHRKASELMLQLCSADERILEDPEAYTAMRSLGDNSVVVTLYCWTKVDDWWATQNDLLQAIKETFDKEGVSFPFPQRDVHLYKAE